MITTVERQNRQMGGGNTDDRNNDDKEKKIGKEKENTSWIQPTQP